jgi:UV DNA damage endonuclease
LENDDRVYPPRILLPFCRAEQVPLVYDVHHHRCLPDGYSAEEASVLAAATWNREPLFHLSSPLRGWHGPAPTRHHDFIAPRDFPMGWMSMDITVEVEAKAKEVAVRRLRSWLERRKAILWNERGRMPSSPPPLTGQKKVLYKVLRLRYK